MLPLFVRRPSRQTSLSLCAALFAAACTGGDDPADDTDLTAVDDTTEDDVPDTDVAPNDTDVEVVRSTVELLSPANGTVVDTLTTSLEFRVQGAAAIAYEVTLGQGAPTRVDGAVAVATETSVPLVLTEGVNVVDLTVFDAVGEADTATVVIVVELPPVVRPTVTVTSPTTGGVVYGDELDVVFAVADADVTAYAVRVGANAPIEVVGALTAGSSETVPVVLDAGANVIEVSVLDALGVADTASTVVVYEVVPKPQVFIDAPLDGVLVHDETVVVEGWVDSSRAVTAAITLGDGAAVPLALEVGEGGASFSVEVDLEIGENEIVVEALDDLDQVGLETITVLRELDDVAPEIAITYPRDGESVRSRQALIRGTVSDTSAIEAVWLEAGDDTFDATLADDGSFTALLPVEPALNDYTVVARDAYGNESELASTVYYGQRLGSGGAHGAALRGGKIYAWGRNNLGQTGLGYISHESRTTHCERTLTATADIALCKATSVSTVDAICANPEFVSPTPSPEPAGAAACRAAVRATRDELCVSAGAGAPNNCATSGTASLVTACDASFGVGTSASDACQVRVVCESAYAVDSEAYAHCAAVVAAVPASFPAPATPYAATEVTLFSTLATPAQANVDAASFVSLGVTFVSLALNQNASSAIDSAGDLWGWGDGANGMLCLGDTNTDVNENDRTFPHKVAPFGAPGTRAIALSRGYDHLLVLRSDGTVWGCGMNNVGQIGDGASGAANNRQLPTQVVGLPADIVQVVAASQSSYAVTSSGAVYAWGRNQYGNLGQGTSSGSSTAFPTPMLVPGLPEVVSLATGRDHVLVSTVDGEIWAWGLNASNQVNDTDGNVLSPVRVSDVTDAMSVYANGNQGFYENPAGQLFGWGQNGSGNLGIPEDDDQPVPTVPVFGISGAQDVGIGALQGFVLRGDMVFAWGWSFHGSLGAGASAIHTWPYRTPVLVRFP